MNDTAAVDYLGLLAYFVIPLVAIFVGPLEAVAGLVLFWFLVDDERPTLPAETTGE